MASRDANPLQEQAIGHTGGHLLIIAGPGTGKTHTLTYRIIQQTQRLHSGQKILAMTFTNKAARQLQDRLAAHLKDAAQVTVGTFHQFCWEVLRQYAGETGLPPDFEILKPEDRNAAGKEIWPKKKVRERNALLDRISAWKSLEFDGPLPDEVKIYNQFLRERGRLDFDDLLLETLILLKRRPDLCAQLQAVYSDIFVDEYQDINALQHALLKMWVGPHGTITAIGDPNQAIYGFRGSDVRYFERFGEDFTDAKIFYLSDNYRSMENLLAASGQVIAGTKHRVPALTAKIYGEGRLVTKEAATDKAEAEYVVHQIEKMVGGTSMFSQDSGRVDTHQYGEHSFGDIAVLYRLHSQGRLLKEAFHRSGIPYVLDGESSSAADDVCPSRGEEVSVDGERVTLMTLHKSKGLEFPVIFIVGCEDNIVPLNLLGLTGDRKEERRLFYVGMTRAKERLYLLYAKRRRLYGKIYNFSPSPFLADIKEELKEYEKTAPRKQRKKEDQMSLF